MDMAMGTRSTQTPLSLDWVLRGTELGEKRPEIAANEKDLERCL